MKSFWSKKFPLIISTLVLLTMPMSFLPLTSCGNENTIQFANFESYMDNKLMNHLTDQYDVQFQWYTVTEMIETKFHRTYDVAAPSGYELNKLEKNGWLEPIEWGKFGIPGVTTPEEAKEKLFADPIKVAIDQMDKMLGYQEEGKSVLDYGIPYFAQSFTFAYKGSKAKFYEADTQTETDKPNWNDIFYTLSPSMIGYNPDLQRRKGMLDDPKSLYDVCRIMETIHDNPKHPENWTNEITEDTSRNRLLQTFSYLTTKSRSRWFVLNTDSGIISRNLADPGENSFGCAFTWSGDALYAAQGAGEFTPHTGNDMHIQKPDGVSLDEIEFLVINNKNHNNEAKLDRIYNVLNDICFKDTWNATKEQLQETIGDRYALWPMQNFDTVNYTPTLKSIYDYVVDVDSAYWGDSDLETRKLYTSILEIDSDVRHLFGRPLSSLQNSDVQWAWMIAKDNL